MPNQSKFDDEYVSGTDEEAEL
ncbi:hypothetical protein DDE82_007020 [Stemphylium lycopersici]|nr:hypothetical protein DDE82_007020 [Stemphylium lycopersici]